MSAKDAAGRKPWRYYYVMAFPLGSSGVTQDKLQEMTEMTAAIEEREEKYLRKVAARNAALEAERRTKEKKGKPTMTAHVAWVLRRLYVVSAVLLLLAVGVLYVMFMEDDGRDHVPQKLVKVATISVTLLLVVNAGGWLASHRRSVNGARALLMVQLVFLIGLAFLLDEVKMVQRSHKNLRRALAGSEESLTQDVIGLLLNGGEVPSLVQRFVFDAPSVFLQWLSAHCAAKPSTKLGYASVTIDLRMWNDNEKSCVTLALTRCSQIDEVIVPILIGELVMVALQVLFTGLFLATCNPLVVGKTFKRRRQFSLRKPASLPLNSSAKVSAALTRLLTFSTVLFGSSNVIASTNLLHFCSIADFHVLFTWILVVCLVSGLSAILAALLVGCRREQRLAGVLLVVAVAAEVFMLAEFIKMAAKLIGPDMTADSGEIQNQKLREVYMKASNQACSSIENWISHVCVSTAGGNPAEFDRSCQHEFMALLLVTFNFTDSYLAWSIAAKLALLVKLMLPALRQAIVNVVSYVWCFSSRGDVAVSSVEMVLQKSPPPLDYGDALELYLKTMKVNDPARKAAEREAFEKEWSARTGRMLSDADVVVTASDFGAIVRTLMLRRLTAVCKLDVSLSVSADGELLLVRIFASDNLLLATLCEREMYRLQFADAVDPGRDFWRDKREVNGDHKVLDGNTVKHKLKLLLADNTMPPKEAKWFPGESLPRVSARVQALSRISRASKGLIRCWNSAPAFASYSPNIQRQFIYKKYPHRLDIPDTYRRSAVLRTVDCIRLTRFIVDAEIDTSAAITSGLVSCFHCLHSTSRFDWNSRATLASSWITFWRPIQLSGEFGPDDHAILNLFGRLAPFRQPLQSVRDYFGEPIAFYFAWLGFYAKMTFIPTLAGIIVVASHHSLVTKLWNFYLSPRSIHTDNAEAVNKIGTTLSLPELVLGLMVIAWSFIFAKLWERKSVWYQLQWGVTACAVSESDTHCSDVEQNPSLCSEVASIQRRLRSWLCVLLLAGINLVVVLAMFLAQGVFVHVAGEKLAVLGSCLCQAYLVQWNGACIPSVAHALSKWEIPGCPSDFSSYRKSVVARMFILQLFNTFTGLILLILSGVGGLATLARFAAPLRPLYAVYNTRIEGHVGICIQMETLLIALFVTQLSIRVFLILSAVGRFRAIHREDHEEESSLSPYPGPDKDYAQLVMQLGLIVMFSVVCPLLPMLALIDCAVKIRQNALELCCIRQRPEPEETQITNGDEVGIELWAPWALLILKLSVPVALGLVFFTADNYDSVSIERRVGWWLIGVLGIWLLTQLFWVLVPRESRESEEAGARNTFIVDRYFGHADVVPQKSTSEGENQGKRTERLAGYLRKPAPSAKKVLTHYEERLELLQRLNVALRKREKLGGPKTLAAAASSVLDDEWKAVESSVKEEEERDSTYSQDAALEEEILRRESESSEEMIGGYFRPVRSAWPPPQQLEEGEKVEENEELQPSRRTSFLPETFEELKSSESRDKSIKSSRGDSGGGEIVPTERRAQIRLSRLFTRIPPPPSSAPPRDDEPGISAPAIGENAELATDESAELGANEQEEEKEKPASVAERLSITITTPSLDARTESPQRRLSPRLTRRPKSSSSSDSDSGKRTSQAEVGGRPPRLRSLTRKSKFSKNSSLKVSGSKGSSISVHGDSSSEAGSPSVPEKPAPRRLSKLFTRIQPPPSSAAALSEPPPPPTVVPSLRHHHDFLSDARSESAVLQTPLPGQRRRSSGNRVQSPPIYERVDLSGLEAVREAANRHHFDFSADEQVWKD